MAEITLTWALDSSRGAPGFWFHETSGVLRPAVEDYLFGRDLSAEQIALLRAYLRQWIETPVWRRAHELRRRIDSLVDRAAIDRWIADAVKLGLDPL